MSMKLIACVLAACVVAVGGAFLIHGDCPFSSGCGTCPKSLESGTPGESTFAATTSCCPDSDEATAPCCAKATVAVKKSCCAEGDAVAVKKSCCAGGDTATSSEPVAAAFGGTVAVGKK